MKSVFLASADICGPTGQGELDMGAKLEVRRIERAILLIRGQRVMLDADLATLYGVETKALNQAVKRNRGRFPADFMFRLTLPERDEVVTVCDHLQRLKYSRTLPYAFTEHGSIMLASVLNSPVAVKVSLQIVRIFLRLRQVLATHGELARRLDDLEGKVDSQFSQVFRVLRQLLEAPEKESRKIGFGGG